MIGKPTIVEQYKTLYIVTDGERFAVLRMRRTLFGVKGEFNHMYFKGIGFWGDGHNSDDWVDYDTAKLRFNRHKVIMGGYEK